MGQSLPLPERIPQPDKDVLASMTQKGFKIQDGEYAFYTMPEGWKFVDHSQRQILPCWYFVNPEGLACYSVRGTWKETYDNYIGIEEIDEPFLYTPREEAPIPNNETSVAAVTVKFLEALKEGNK